jgi:hypothetical protein
MPSAEQVMGSSDINHNENVEIDEFFKRMNKDAIPFADICLDMVAKFIFHSLVYRAFLLYVCVKCVFKPRYL